MNRMYIHVVTCPHCSPWVDKVKIKKFFQGEKNMTRGKELRKRQPWPRPVILLWVEG